MSNIKVNFLNKPIYFKNDSVRTERRARTIFTKEPITIKWIKEVKEGEIVLDVGANVGTYTMLLGSLGAKVYAFEPEALNYACLYNNIRLNKMDDTVLGYCVGVLDYDGFSTVNNTGDEFVTGAACYSVEEEVDFNLNPAQIMSKQGVPVITLDTFCSSLDIIPDHIKIDVDGLEHRIIAGNCNTLSKAKTVIVELNNNLQHHKESIDVMKSMGFNLDDDQVKASTRTSGAVKGLAEHLFYK